MGAGGAASGVDRGIALPLCKRVVVSAPTVATAIVSDLFPVDRAGRPSLGTLVFVRHLLYY